MSLSLHKSTNRLKHRFEYYSWAQIPVCGVQFTDIEQETLTGKVTISDLGKHLRTMKIAGGGYLYIFDLNMNMVIHPNKNIKGTNFAPLLDPATGKPIGNELIAEAKTTVGSYV
ncbi:MAG: hypothetical protein GY702_27550 [Desulfobulbaceae bacterium]|nr:hypothetical protein [Desulfobulbaceae bacterium]